MQLGAGQALGQVFSLARNIIIAGLLDPSDYGVAATFLLTMAMINLISNISAEKLLIQSPHGDDEAMQRTIHTTEILRGSLSGAVLFLLAPLATRLFHVPEATWAFQTLALLPVLRGFRHLDIDRAQRQHNFKPMIVSNVVSQAVALALAWPITAWLGDYSAVLWILLAQTATLVAFSHLLARRPYRLGWSPLYGRQVLHFGWPLLLNGLLMYGAVQGDQLVIGASYDMAKLGVFAAAAGIAMAPPSVLTQIFGAIALPTFSQAQADVTEMQGLFRSSLQILAFLAGAVVIFFLVVGPALMVLLYNPSYQAAGEVIGLLGVMQGIRIMRSAQSTASMAMGDTRTPLYANIWRSLSLIGIIAAAAIHAPLIWIVLAGVAGEGVAFVAAQQRLRTKHGLSRRVVFMPMQMLVLACATSEAAALIIGRHASFALSLTIGLLVGLIYTALCLAVFPEFRQAVIGVLHDLRHTLARSEIVPAATEH